MPNKQPKRVLPPDIFDTIEFVALVFGGIGRGSDFEGEDDNARCPVCVYGLARAAQSLSGTTGDLTDLERVWLTQGEIGQALEDTGLYRTTNDDAVVEVNNRLRRPIATRVTFKRWARQCNVVRGTTPNEEVV